METHHRTVDEILAGASCPLPLEVIPNQMGINLCSVVAVGWQQQPDGQLVNLTIYFEPAIPQARS